MLSFFFCIINLKENELTYFIIKKQNTMKCDASVAIQYQRSRKETDAKGLFSKDYLIYLPIEV